MKSPNDFRVAITIVWVLFCLAACTKSSPQPTIGVTLPTTSEPKPILISTPTAKPAILPSLASPPVEQTIQPTATKARFTGPEIITRGEIQDIAASPDGRWLAVASASGLYLHNAQTLALDQALLEDVWVSGAAFSPDSQSLAVYGKGWLQLLDLTGVPESKTVQASVVKLDFSPDGNRLIGLEGSGSLGSLRIWELPDWQEHQLIFEVSDTTRSMAVSPDGKSVALGSETGRVELFDIESTARQAILSEGTGLAVTDLAFSPDGSVLAGAEVSAEGRLRVWSVTERKKVIEEYSSGYYSIRPFVAFSADGERLLGGMGDLAIVWERKSGQPVSRLNGYASFLMDLEISPAGNRLAYTTYNWPAYVQDLAVVSSPRLQSVPYYQAFNVAFSPDGKNVASGLYSYSPEPKLDEPAEMVRTWDAFSGAEVQTLPGASAAAYTVLDPLIALADSRGELRVVDPLSENEVCLPGCACDPASGQTQPGSCVFKLPHDLSPMKLGYSPDGSLLSVWGVAGSWSASGLIDLATGKEVAWFEGGSRISFGPNGLVALGVDELNADHGIAAHWLMLYDYKSGKELQRVELPAAGVAALSPDGRWLAVGLSSLEKTNPTDQDPPDPAKNGLMIWDVAAWKQAAYFPIHYGVTRLAFSPQGDFLITASETGKILRWYLAP